METKYLSRHLKVDGGDAKRRGGSMKLEYYLIEGEVTYIEELAGKKVYGIGVVKKDADNIIEKEVVCNFSCCPETTKAVLGKLADNSVLPVELKYILEDMVNM